MAAGGRTHGGCEQVPEVRERGFEDPLGRPRQFDLLDVRSSRFQRRGDRAGIRFDVLPDGKVPQAHAQCDLASAESVDRRGGVEAIEEAGRGDRRVIARIDADHDFGEQGGVGDGARHRPVPAVPVGGQRLCAGDPTVRGFEPDGAGEGGGQPRGSGDVRGRGQGRKPGCQRSTGPAGGPAR